MWEWNAKSQFFKAELAGDLIESRVNWMASLDLLSCSVQLTWQFSFSACFTRVHPLAACQSRATRKIQSWVLTSVHSLEHFFTLSHTLPLHDSHLYTGFLSAELQANLSWNKANTWLIKFNLTLLMCNLLLMTILMLGLMVVRVLVGSTLRSSMAARKWIGDWSLRLNWSFWRTPLLSLDWWLGILTKSLGYQKRMGDV